MKKILWFSLVLGVAAGYALAADDDRTKTGNRDGKTPPASDSRTEAPRAYTPPVLRDKEVSDTVLVVLPGPAPAPVVPAPAAVAVASAVSEAVAEAKAESKTAAPAGKEDEGGGPRPYFRHSPKVYPDGFEHDTLGYFQDRIGKWTADDIAEILGPSTRQRPAYGENQKENGAILAFADPTERFKEYELDFDGSTGMLRTVFAYPVQMTWQECRRQYGAKVTATDASKGRRFYSYADRRLDVLVGPDGKVVSLGLY
jgi:hypothetical protein